MARMGRPPKRKSEVKGKTVTLRLTKAERRAVDSAAKKAGVSVAEWARQALVAAAADG